MILGKSNHLRNLTIPLQLTCNFGCCVVGYNAIWIVETRKASRTADMMVRTIYNSRSYRSRCGVPTNTSEEAG